MIKSSAMPPAAGALLLALVIFATAQSAAEVRRCLNADGQVVFTQFGCPEGTQQQQATGDTYLNIIGQVPLTDSEQQRLTDLTRQLTRTRQARERNHQKSQHRMRRAREKRAAGCLEAEQALATLAATRRKGYSASQGRRYDAEESRWREQKRALC